MATQGRRNFRINIEYFCAAEYAFGEEVQVNLRPVRPIAPVPPRPDPISAFRSAVRFPRLQCGDRHRIGRGS